MWPSVKDREFISSSEIAPKNMVIHIEFVLFHGFHVGMSWIKGGPGPHMEDGVLGNLAPPGDLEESTSHHSDRE